MASRIDNLLEESSSESLTDIMNMLKSSLKYPQEEVHAVNLTPILNKPGHILLANNDKDDLINAINCTRVNSLTVINWTEKLPIYSATKTDLPRTEKLILKEGISAENILKLLRNYASTHCDSLLLSGNCLGTLKPHQIKGFHFKHLTEFSFDLIEPWSIEEYLQFQRKHGYRGDIPPIGGWYSMLEYIPEYVTKRNCPHVIALIKLFQVMKIPTLKKVSGVFPFATQDEIWKSLHISFGQFMQRHGSNIESVSLKLQGPCWFIRFLEDEFKPLFKLTEINLNFNFLVPSKESYFNEKTQKHCTRLNYLLRQPSLTTKHGIRLVLLLRGFPKLKSYTSNFGCTGFEDDDEENIDQRLQELHVKF